MQGGTKQILSTIEFETNTLEYFAFFDCICFTNFLINTTKKSHFDEVIHVTNNHPHARLKDLIVWQQVNIVLISCDAFEYMIKYNLYDILMFQTNLHSVVFYDMKIGSCNNSKHGLNFGSTCSTSSKRLPICFHLPITCF